MISHVYISACWLLECVDTNTNTQFPLLLCEIIIFSEQTSDAFKVKKEESG